MAVVLITGGAGFIGSHLVDFYLEKGDEVIAVDNLSTGQLANIARHRANPRFSFHRASLQDFTELPDIARQVDFVFHMAAAVGVRQVLKSPLNVLDSNMQATDYLFRTLLACRKDARVVVASSSEVYGLQDKVPFKETDDLALPSRDPLRWCYAVTKITGEMLAYAYAYEHGMNATAIRLFNTAGPRQSPAYGMVLPNFVERAAAGDDLEIFGDGSQTRSFSDVRDTVAALSLVAQCDQAKGETLNIGSDKEISIRSLAELVIGLAQSKSKIAFKSYKEAYGHNFVDTKRRCADTSKLRELTGFVQKFSLDDTILSLIESTQPAVA